jgi:hypothetical protein
MSDADETGAADGGAEAAPAEACSGFTRRTLRGWAVFQVAYAGLLLLAAVWLVPWKSPAWNLGLMAYACLHLAAAPGLWRLRRWGWWLAFTGSGLGLLASLGLCTALVATWAYLRGIYGEFGAGASVGALLLAVIALGVLGLYPALLARALLRREVRADLGLRLRGGAAALALGLAPLLVGVGVDGRYSMSTLDPVPPEGRQQAVVHLRAALDGDPDGERGAGLEALEGLAVGEGPLYVTVWEGGRVRLRVRAEGEDLAAAVRAAGRELAAAEQAGGRLKVDRVVGVTPVFEALLSLSVDPGRDGLRRGERLLLPDDLVRGQMFGVQPLVPGSQELKLGLDTQAALAALGGGGDARLERVRTESWVEYQGRALAVVRGNTPGPEAGPVAWRQAAIAGGEFILRQLTESGQLRYSYDPLEDEHPALQPGEYSLARHSGTIYSLAVLYGHTRDPRFQVGAQRTIEWLARRVPLEPGPPAWGYLANGEWAGLGGAALGVVGLLEYQRQTGDRRYESIARRLAEFLIRMQRPDGEFHHLYHSVERRIDPARRELYFSGEAALALVLAAKVLDEPRYLEAARRALDYLTGPNYEEFFLGRFIYGDDHWTCIAVEEAWPELAAPRYLEFSQGYAGFMRRLQYEDEGWAPGFAGYYGFSGLMLPQPPAAAGYTEAFVSTWVLSNHHGAPDPVIAAQVAASLDALTRDQIRPDNAWMMPDPEAAAGGIRRSLAEQEVRIDFTQHAVCALLRGAALLGEQ